MGCIQLAYAADEFPVKPEGAGFGALKFQAQYHSFHFPAQFEVALVADYARVGVESGELGAYIAGVHSRTEPVLVRSPGKGAGPEG